MVIEIRLIDDDGMTVRTAHQCIDGRWVIDPGVTESDCYDDANAVVEALRKGEKQFPRQHLEEPAKVGPPCPFVETTVDRIVADHDFSATVEDIKRQKKHLPPPVEAAPVKPDDYDQDDNEDIASASPAQDNGLTVKQEKALQPMHFGSAVIGYVEEIHGPDAKECDNYKPTRYELIELVRHWLKVKLDIHLDWFFYQETGSTGIRLLPYAAIRLDRLAEVLGAERIDEVWKEVEKETRGRLGEEDWRVFLEGTPEEKQAVAHETYQAHESLDKIDRDQAKQEKAFAHLKDNPCGYYVDDSGNFWSLYEPSMPDDDEKGRLLLRVTTPRGASKPLVEYAIDRPKGWHPPFGFR